MNFEVLVVFRQAANDKYCKTSTFKLLECQPELVEGGFNEAHRLRQAQTDTTIKSNILVYYQHILFEKSLETFYQCLNRYTLHNFKRASFFMRV